MTGSQQTTAPSEGPAWSSRRVIRNTVHQRVAQVITVLGVVVTLLMTLGIVQSDRASPAVAAAVGLAGVLLAAGLAWFNFARLAHSGLYVDEDGLELRNPFSRRRFGWEDVDEVRLEGSSSSEAFAYVVPRSGTPVRVHGVSARFGSTRRRIEHALAELNCEIARRREGPARRGPGSVE
jgi:hypothetical protein